MVQRYSLFLLPPNILYKNESKNRPHDLGYDSQYDTKEERRVITGSEAETARSNGEAIRKNHKGTPYRTVSPTSTKPY